MTLWILSTLFLCIIMLNLLIAVVSDTYARVEESSSNELYKNFADLINENSYLVPSSVKTDHDNQGSYLYIASLDANDTAVGQMEIQCNDLKQSILNKTKSIDKLTMRLAQTLTQVISKNTERFNLMVHDESASADHEFKGFLRKMDTKRP
jgi:hypothetical protein